MLDFVSECHLQLFTSFSSLSFFIFFTSLMFLYIFSSSNVSYLYWLIHFILSSFNCKLFSLHSLIMETKIGQNSFVCFVFRHLSHYSVTLSFMVVKISTKFFVFCHETFSYMIFLLFFIPVLCHHLIFVFHIYSTPFVANLFIFFLDCFYHAQSFIVLYIFMIVKCFRSSFILMCVSSILKYLINIKIRQNN